MKLSISVIIPAYNAGRFIRQAIGSVQRQTAPVAEIIVVDDHSTDRTAEIAEKMGARVLRKTEKKRSIAASRNLGIEASSGEWIAFLDADDYWDKRKLEFQWQAIKTCPEAGLVSSFIRPFQSGKTLLAKTWAGVNDYRWAEPRIVIDRYCSYFPKVSRVPIYLPAIQTSTVLLPRKVFSEVGTFDETLPAHEDTDLWLRVLNKFAWTLVHRKLSWHRRHDDNSTNDKLLYAGEYVPRLEKMLRSPDDYPPGAIESCLLGAKAGFVEKGRRMAREIRRIAE